MPAQKIIGDYHTDTLQHQQATAPVVIIPSHSTDAAFQAGAGTHQRKRSTASSPFPGSSSNGSSGTSPIVHVNGQQLPVDARNRAHPGTKRTHSGRELTGQAVFDEKDEIEMVSLRVLTFDKDIYERARSQERMPYGSSVAALVIVRSIQSIHPMLAVHPCCNAMSRDQDVPVIAAEGCSNGSSRCNSSDGSRTFTLPGIGLPNVHTYFESSF